MNEGLPGEIDLIVDAVKSAGAKLLELWPANPKNKERELDVQSKADGSAVSEADYASNEILLNAIGEHFPNDGILSEEVPPSPDLKDKQRIWIIDPLDGTKSFITGKDDFSVLVGLVVDGVPETGIMYLPARDILAVGSGAGGTVINGQQGVVSKSASPRPNSIYFRHVEAPDPDLAAPMVDSGLAQLNVATGEFDGVIIKLLCHREWDIAAPTQIIQQAGGKVTDETGGPIDFTSGEFNHQFFVASNGKIHDQLLEMVSSML